MGKSRKNRRKNRKSSASQQTANAPVARSDGAAGASLDDARREMNDLIASGKTKAAVDLAKLTHKQLDSPASETLLAEAYAARVRGMLDKGMGDEAKALLALARGRHPSQSTLFDSVGRELAARTGTFDDMVAPLADPDLPADERRRIEDTVRRQVTDLSALSECPTLPKDHPLRRGAAAVWDAFQAVSSGPVEDEAAALPEISRRSPLAPWKALIRAMACFYRREDEACRRHLQAIDPESPPARLVTVLEGLLNGVTPPKKRSPANDLARAVSGDRARLKNLLDRADYAIAEDSFYADDLRAMKAIRSAANACAGLDAPDAERIRRNLWVRAYYTGYDTEALDRAMPAPVPRDAAFWALLAHYHAEGNLEYEENCLLACACWEEFRGQAVREGLLADKSKEEAIVHRLMLRLRLGIPKDEYDQNLGDLLSRDKRYTALYRGQPKAIREAAAVFGVVNLGTAFFLRPEEIFARIEARDPAPELYRQWQAWADENASAKDTEAIARRWAKAFPGDPEPCLRLVDGAEKRGAYTKALKYLEEAEAVDALNPGVRRARFRLHLQALMRHYKQGKPHLAAKDLDAIEALPVADTRDQGALRPAMRWALSTLEGDQRGADQFEQATAELTGDALAATVLCWGLAKGLGVPVKHLPKLGKPADKPYRDQRAKAAGMAAALAAGIGVTLALPDGWETVLRQDLRRRTKAQSADPAHMIALAEVCIQSGDDETGYLATGVALSQEGSHVARALYQRAMTLSRGYPWRRVQCLAAAIEVARKQRDFALIDKAVDEMNASFASRIIAEPQSVKGTSAEHVEHVIAHERKQKQFPKASRYAHIEHEKHYYQQCKCELCEEERGRGPFAGMDRYGFSERAFEEFYDDEEEDEAADEIDFLDDSGPFGDEIPEDLARELDRMAERMMLQGKSEVEIQIAVVKLMMDYALRQSKKESRQKRKSKKEPRNIETTSDKQGDLFDDVPF